MSNQFARVPLLLLALVAGCATSPTAVNIDYVPSATFASIHAEIPYHRISVGDIADSRGLEDPKIIFHKTNLYGDTMSGAYLAEEPVASIVRDAFVHFFESPAPGPDEVADYEIYGRLVDFEYEAISGFWSAKYNSEMSVQLYMRNLQTGEIVWSESFLGRAHIDEFNGSNDLVDQMLSGAIDDLLVQVQSSEFLSSRLSAGR